jgi:apolipoprotein D and lipocalin family protein
MQLTVVPALFFGCSATYPDLPVVDQVDLDRYVGRWYEIASFPAPFQQNCVGTRADYSLNDDGTIAVVNSCYDGSFDARLRTANGTARAVGGSNNAKLLVRFFLFDGDYWILELGEDPDYGYAVVGAPSRDYLWILSRQPQLSQDIVDAILDRLPELGFEVERLEFTEQTDS